MLVKKTTAVNGRRQTPGCLPRTAGRRESADVPKAVVLKADVLRVVVHRAGDHKVAVPKADVPKTDDADL